jgi:hypothetical protein
MFQGADELLAYIEENDIETVDVRFCDLPGVMQHFTIPAKFLTRDIIEDGLSFDGSSIRGFQKIHESDMALLPDLTSAYVDPFRKSKTLNMNWFVHDPITKEAYSRDPRNIARKAEEYLKSTGIGDTAFMGPEAEFYVFDSVRFETKQNAGYYFIESEAGAWASGRDDIDGHANRGYKVKYKGGYFPVAPVDHFGDLRDDMVRHLQGVGLTIERAHHEVGTAGQGEIATKFDTLLRRRRQRHEVQVRRQEHRLGGRQDRHLHAEADLRRQRFGHARATSRSGRTASRCSPTRPATRASPTWPAGTSAASCTTRRRCWRSPTRPRTPTTAWCRASRRRSTWSTASATARPASASR